MPYPSYDRTKAAVIEVSAWVLAISASMILGLLSFCGMYAIWPYLSLSSAAFFFAIVIEGQIYLDNILSTLRKWTDPQAYEHQLTDLYLQEKLVDYDKNRDLFLLRAPNPDDIRRVCEHNQVIIFRVLGEYDYRIGFRNQDGQYEQHLLDEDEIDCRFLSHYTQEQFMEIGGHHDRIQEIVRSFDSSLEDRPQKEYPAFIRAYITQCQYVRKLNCHLHTQSFNANSQKELESMTAHLTRLDEELNNALFHPNSVMETQDNVEFRPKYRNSSYTLNLSTMQLSSDNPRPKPKKPKVRTRQRQLPVINPQLNSEENSQTTLCEVTKEPAVFDLQDLQDDDPVLTDLSTKTYEFHRKKLIEWISADREAWQTKLVEHTWHSRIAFVMSAFAGLIMGIGTTYLIMEAVVVIPWLAALSLTLFPPVIGPLAVLAGAAHGLLIYNSLTDMLLENPATKFMDRIRNISWQDMTVKRGVILALSVILLAVTIFLTLCIMGTWITVFHKTQPLFAWFTLIPNLILNTVIPILIGLSILPFSIQSLTNTVEGLEEDPNLDGAMNSLNPRNWTFSTNQLPGSWEEASVRFSEKLWQHWVPNFLGISAEEFANETPTQRKNPYRIIYRLLFEPLRDFIFIGHLTSAGVTSDQIDWVSAYFSFGVNFFFEWAEDRDWILGRPHVDNIDTLALLKERAQKSDDHNHDKNIPMQLLKFLFEPILRRAAKWDNDYRAPDAENNEIKRYEKMQGLKPEARAPQIPKSRKESNFNLFFFKTAMYESSASLSDECCMRPV